MPLPTADEVLAFWFGPPDDPGPALASAGPPQAGDSRLGGRRRRRLGGEPARPQWFAKEAAFDALVVQRFGALIEQALVGAIDDWAAAPLAPRPALARVLVLDQFTRHAFRGSARAFAGDAAALQTARALVASGLDRQLGGVQRQFAYLPFEHAEDLAHQRTALQLFEQLGRDEPALAGLAEWARRHHDIVARFGRFPHRNAALGRVSNAAEAEFLKQPGSAF